MTNELLSSNEVQFDVNAVEGIDGSMVQDSGPMFPIMQWNSGDSKMKKLGTDSMDYAGGFFMKADAVDDAIMERGGWVKTTWTHNDGTEEAGWYRRQMAVAVISMRKRWEVYEAGSRRPQAFPWAGKGYEQAKAAGRPKGRTQVLCIVKGIEEAGPVVLTLGGMAGLSFEGNRQSMGALVRFQQSVITAANLASAAKGHRNKRWPLFAFWLPVGADRDAKGEPNFTKVGQGNDTTNIVLPVALGLPDKPAGVNLNQFYVGNELLEQCKEIFMDASTTWTNAWDNIQPDAEQATEEQAAAAVETPAMMSADALAALGV